MLSYHLSRQTMVCLSPLATQCVALDGGGRRIRTFEVDDGRFTVCSLWPLGNPTWVLDGAGYRNRTGDLLITSQLLYLLS